MIASHLNSVYAARKISAKTEADGKLPRAPMHKERAATTLVLPQEKNNS